MTNQEILKQLIFERDEIYQQLSSTSLSALFNREYESLLSGELFLMNDDRDDLLDELRQLRENKTYDAAFDAKVNLINTFNEPLIIKNFTNSWKMAFKQILNDLTTEIQAALIIYDAYDLPSQNTLELYGKNEYPVLPVSQYLPSSFYDNSVQTLHDVFDFSQAWPDCEEFDWTTEHIEAYFELQKLFNLNSRVIMHKALSVMDENGSLSALKLRPFFFYITEHDLEVAMLYKLS